MPVELEKIAVVHSPYKEKFGIPRQAGLIAEATGFVELLPPYNNPDALRGVDGFTHIWLFWLAHMVPRNGWKPTVRPPRLGGNERVGVFASRSIFRPNPVGQSLVKLDQVVAEKNRCGLMVSGLDVLDGTPVLDIKPYLPWADRVPDAAGGFAHEEPGSKLDVRISPEAEAEFAMLQDSQEQIAKLIERVIAHDPRPAFHESGRSYGVKIVDFEVGFLVVDSTAWITSLVDVSGQNTEKG